MSTNMWNRTITPISGGAYAGMPTSVDVVVPAMSAFGGAVAGAAAGTALATRERHVDAATKQSPGTQVWSPPI